MTPRILGTILQLAAAAITVGVATAVHGPTWGLLVLAVWLFVIGAAMQMPARGDS